MTRPTHAQAPKGATGTCRDRRRPRGGRRRAWVHPFRRATRALTDCAMLICTTAARVKATARDARQRPVRSSRKLQRASARVADLSMRLHRVARDLARAQKHLARDPEHEPDLPLLVREAAESWVIVNGWLNELAGDVHDRHSEVLRGLATGALVPEEPADPRPRIRIAPRPVPIRAFLLRRRSRVIDRIAAILRRRRRTPRPAAVTVPPDTHQGRAPPLSSIGLL